MTYQPNTNFKDSNGVDLGKKLISKDYLLEVYGSLLDTLAPGINPTPALWVWGRNTSGQLGVNDTTSRSTPVTTLLGGTNWKSIAGGGYHTVALKTDGTLWSWGSNTSGRLGVNDTTNRNTPVTTLLGGTNWKSIAGGGTHTVALKTDGTLWSWGNNSYGQLGVNDDTDRSTPVTTLLGGTNWKSIACGGPHTIALKTDGTLWSWGNNGNGQLGVNDISNRNTPVTTLLGGTNWKSIAGRLNHTIALKTDGTLWSWGNNANGQLGVNNTTSRSTPVTTLLGGNNWKSIAGGNGHTVALKTDGTLWTWGLNTSGQLGVNNTTQRNTPVTTLLGGTNWKSISAGNGHTVALKTDGTLWSWGSNTNGQLGVNDTTNRNTPVTTLLGGTNWKSIAGGDLHTIALKTDGTLWSWGLGSFGQLGVNNTTNRSTPVTTVLGGSNWKSIAGGGYHTIAIQYTPDP
jgi:alpha-tubulin suppressor-like RCC1 family protein